MYDSVYLTTDTILITVVDTTHLNNGTKVTIWKRVSLLNGTDSLYVDNKLSWINIYSDKLTTTYPIKKYVFSIAVGNYWVAQNLADTSKVIFKGDTTILACAFQNSYKLIRDFRTPLGLNIIKEKEWFAPNIGTIYREFKSYGSGNFQNYKIELLYYLIK